MKNLTKIIKKNRIYLVIAFSALLGCFLLRSVNLNSLPVFADESIYVRWAQVMRAEPTLRFLPLSDGKQPLYMWGVIPFFKVISDPLLAGRFLSVLAGTVTCAGIGIAAYLLFKSKRIAVAASVIWAVIPFSVFFDRMALADSLLTMFFIWTFIFSYLSLKYTRLDMSMIAGFCLGFAWLTKSPAIFLLALIPVLFILLEIKPSLSARFIKSIILVLVTYVIGFAMYNILRLGPEFQMIAIRNKDYVYPLSEIIRRPLDPLIPHLKDTLQFYLYFTTPVGVLLALSGLFLGKMSHWRPRFVLAVWWLLPLLCQAFIAKAYTARYLLYTVPFSVILMSYALEVIGQHTKKHLLTITALALLLISCAGMDLLLIFNPQAAPLPRIERMGYLEQWTAGTGIKQAAEIIKGYSQKGPVLVGSEGFFGTPFDALSFYLNDQKNVRVIGVGVWIESVHEKLINALGDNQVFLVVNSSRFHGDPGKLGLKLLASYPKAVSPDSSQEYLLLFEVIKDFPR